ncbi:hypothetical protein LWI29_018755 [Acer saccharum]|uniref:Uncharacterized protein n=1 Tax=Acer saccharum TaxID=4024 RepID=A0AA39STX7_ACESA|nr:hypothetical protein LWI29_018755 [Acer saccharum]
MNQQCHANFSEEQIRVFTKQLEKGKELVTTCKAITGRNKNKKRKYTKMLVEMDSSLMESLAFWYKKRILAEVLILLLEIISIVLYKIGGSNRLFLVASFLLSAIGFVTTIYKSFFPSTVPTVTRSESERQLIAVEIVFSFILLVLTYIQLIKVFLGAKSNNNNNESLLPLAFAVISVVFIFRNNEEGQADSDSESVSPIISPVTPAIVDGSVIRRVPSTLHQRTTSTQSNNEEAQVVSDSESVSQIISTETPASVDESAIKRVPCTLHQRTTSTQSNNEEAQVVSNSASVSQIISTETHASVDESATSSQRRTSTQSNNQLHNIELRKEMIKGAKAVRETANLSKERITTTFRKEMIKGAKLVRETAKFRKEMIKGAKLVLK